MHDVIVLDQSTLSAFRTEHPWLVFPDAIHEVTIHFNEDGGPRKMTAARRGSDGQIEAADVDALGSDVILALLAYAPRGAASVEARPELEKVWEIIENLPRLGGSSKTDDVTAIEAERRARLEEAFSIVRGLALSIIGEMELSSTGEGGACGREALAKSLPLTLDAVRTEQKPVWSRLDLWGVVSVLRDELALPADHELSSSEDNSYFSRESLDQAVVAAMSGPIVQALFDLSVGALCVSTLGGTRSRYIRVNQAYLDLVGRTWEEIQGSEMLSTGIVTDGEARGRRLDLLDREGGYVGEHADVITASGDRIRVTISARRISIAGQLFDFEIMVPVQER